MKSHTLHFKSPGRINLIGEHTDYNSGYVLPAAIDRCLTFHLQKAEGPTHATFHSHNMQAQFQVNLESVKPGEGWENYLLGVLHQLQLRGKTIHGFTCSITSDLPLGSGLSSSAALECGLAWGLNELFQMELSPWEIIELSQAAEHTYVGTQCGIMDQFACVMGKAGHFILLDCQSLKHRYIPADLGDYRLLLLNTGVTHDLASSAYNQRREACQTGVGLLSAAFPDVKSLRDATPEMLESQKKNMSKRIYNRCKYVIEENLRVLHAVEALEAGKMELLGQLLLDTHRGLRDEYEVSCAELDFLVDEAAKFAGVAGARMVGGGFGGCTLNLVKTEAAEAFQTHIMGQYQKVFGVVPEPIAVGIGPGVGQLI